MKMLFKPILLLTLLVYIFSCSNDVNKKKTIVVKINKNIETDAILYIVSDIGINAHEGSLSYNARQLFDFFSDHLAVDLLKKFINQDGLWAPLDLFLLIDDFPNGNVSHELYDELGYSSTFEFIDSFIKAVNDFYKKAKVSEFMAKHKDYYEKSINDVIKNLPDDRFIQSMEQYYGKKNQSYNIVPSPTLFPYIGIGFSIRNNSKTNIYYIAGPFEEPDSTKDFKYSFDSPTEIREMSVHEFGHSFVNPLTVKQFILNKLTLILICSNKYKMRWTNRLMVIGIHV